MALKLTWLNHASFRLEGQQRVYLDPWKLAAGSVPADVIIVSHSHYDHCSRPDVAAIRGPETVVLAAADAAAQLGEGVRQIGPGQRHEVGDLVVETVPAYNVTEKFHPKENGWVGVVLETQGQRIYYAGDTDQIPEMAELGRIDVALLPVGGTYTMDAAQAAAACEVIRPKQAVPYHWGDIVGSGEDARAFAERAGCAVTVLQPGESLTLG
ncbi:MAG: MBL fold metallo-hydrolase [Phycisphaerae bacterium]